MNTTNRNILASLVLALLATGHASAEVYDVGNSWVGMTATGTATSSGTDTYYRTDMQGEVNIHALGLTAKAAEGSAVAAMFNTSQGYIACNLKIIGKNVVGYQGTFNTSGTARTPAIVAGIDCPKLKFGIGPLTLGVKFYANASAWVEGTAAITLNPNPALPPVAQFKAGPQAEAVVGGEVDLSLVVVSGGVSGEVRVAKHALNGILTVDFAQKKGQADVVWSRWDPEGSVVGFVKLKILFIKKTWSKTLVEWHGKQTDVNLVSKTFNLIYKKPAAASPAA